MWEYYLQNFVYRFFFMTLISIHQSVKNALNWLLCFNRLHVKLLAQLCHDVTTIKMSINRKYVQSCGLARVKLLDRSFIIEFII